MRRRTGRAITAAAAAATAFVCLPAAACAADGSVSGSLTAKLPKQGRATAVATSLADGRIVRAQRLTKGGSFSLTLPPGAYALRTTVVPPVGGGAVSTVAFPVSLKSGQRRRKLTVKPKKLKVKKGGKSAYAARAAIATRAYTQESGATTSGVVAFTVEDFAGGTGDWVVMNRGLSDVLSTDLAQGTPCKTALVANRRELEVVKGEVELQKSKYFDPKTAVKRDFILPDRRVQGTITPEPGGGSARVSIAIVHARTGRVTGSVNVTIAAADFWDAEARLAKQIGELLCRKPQAYDLKLAVDGTGTFISHRATARVDSTLRAPRTGASPDGTGIVWSGNASATWTNASATPTGAIGLPCTFAPNDSPFSWSAHVSTTGDDQIKVVFYPDTGAMNTFTATCQSDKGTATLPNQPGPAMFGLGGDEHPITMETEGGSVPVSGGYDGGGQGWTNAGTLTVDPIWE